MMNDDESWSMMIPDYADPWGITMAHGEGPVLTSLGYENYFKKYHMSKTDEQLLCYFSVLTQRTCFTRYPTTPHIEAVG